MGRNGRGVVVISALIFVLAAPVAAVAAAGGFTSSTAAPAVSARNSSSSNGAKAVSGVASATRGVTYGIYGSSASRQGYGVYSAGPLGIKGLLVCSRCVTGSDINPDKFPTVPNAQNATTLASHPTSYYGHVESFSVSDLVGPIGSDIKTMGVYDGLDLGFRCEIPEPGQPPWVGLFVRASTPAANGAITVANYTGQPAPHWTLTTSWSQPASQSANVQPDNSITEASAFGAALYVNSGSGAVATLTYSVSVDGSHCEVAGQLLDNG